jgi:hypothetical protein
MDDTGKCESRTARHGRRCVNTAVWLVRVGWRKADEQGSCSLHLPPTCEAMIAAELARAWPRLFEVAVTVTRVRAT